MFIQTLVVIFIIQILFFIGAATFKTDKVTDLAYGLTFVVIALALTWLNATFFPVQVLLTILITIWGLRLAGYLFIRILKTKKDRRFDGIRENPKKFAAFWSFQTLAIWVIMWPSIILLTSKSDLSSNVYTLIGISISVVGLLLETTADQQKFKFKSDPANKDKWIQSGFWKYSRYPNYFGEMLVWWGIFVIAIPFLSGISWGTVLGPVFITFILLKVSGIPTLEKRYNKKFGNDPNYQQYVKQTSLLVPLPPKTS